MIEREEERVQERELGSMVRPLMHVSAIINGVGGVSLLIDTEAWTNVLYAGTAHKVGATVPGVKNEREAFLARKLRP